MCSFVSYFRFHLQVISRGICLSLSDLLYLVWESLAPSMSCKWHYSVFLWLNNSLLYICVPSSLPTHLSMDIYVTSIPRRGPSSWTILPGECRRFCYVCPDENIHHHPVLASSTRHADLSRALCVCRIVESRAPGSKSSAAGVEPSLGGPQGTTALPVLWISV